MRPYTASRPGEARRRPLRRALAAVLAAVLLLAPVVASQNAARTIVLRPPVEVLAAAVAQTEQGLVGTLANVSITVADGGSGHVFIDTYPLTQVDMQGSARLAVRVASSVTGVSMRSHDFFFVVRSGSSIIGGPSAGAILTVGTIAALANLTIDPTIMMTGTVNPDGTIGPVGGVPEKATAAAEANARVFLYPAGQTLVRERGDADRVVEVNMTAFCDEELRILCRPVVDVREAALLLTGQDFRRPAPPGDIGGESFRSILRPKGNALLAEADADLAEAKAAFEGATDLPAERRDDLAERMGVANAAIGEARAGLARGEYYTTASKAFQSAIASRYVRWSVEHEAADDPAAYLEGVRSETASHVAAVEDAARDADWGTLGALDGVGAAQTKAREARDYLERAELAIRVTPQGLATPAQALDALAFAWERADTVPWWLEIAKETPPGAPVDAATVRGATTDVADTAQESVVYAQAILSQIGLPSDRLVDAARLVNLSRAELADGLLPAALLHALDAEVRAGVALTLAGYVERDVPPELLDLAQGGAAVAIADARAQGLEPVLAVSYYEFAGAIPEVPVRLTFYQTARATASLDVLLAGGGARPVDSRFVGEGRLPDLWVPREYLIAFFALGIATGAAAAVGAVVMSRAEKLTEE
ncbi:MAG TPA: S16 family serine protease [Candidatus Thermoplasmatota archaeon]|nr:S16 family serine protease [Candidatus Thermoplasmatota archaeon]